MTVLEHTTSTTSCDRESRITKSLLGYGVIAGPVYVVVSLAQALTRPGFDPARSPDPLYVLDGERYVPLDAERYAAILSGAMRF